MFAAIGALCPLIDGTGIIEKYITGNGKIILGQWGYVSIALAAAIIGYDKYFGLSTGWMRYIVTLLSLEKTLKEFQYDWAILMAQQMEQEPEKMNTPIFLQKTKEFTLQVENLVKQETDAWAQEFQSNITQLEKVLKTEVEARKPGGIKITVTNAREFDKVTIRLNDTQVKEFAGVIEGLIDSVPPGRYEVRAIGKKGDKEFKGTKVVEVQAGSMASLELGLPTS